MDAEIPPEEVDELLGSDADVRVVDIRPEAEFERGHVPDSENIPFHALADEIERLDGAERVVTVCPHGKASVQAARLVASYEGLADDVRVESMAGGLEAWEYGLECDGEVESETGRPENETGRSGSEGGAENESEESTSEGPDAPF